MLIFEGRDGNDKLFGSASWNGVSGDDMIFGYGGYDEIYGLSGNDILFGGGWHDVLDGGADDDILVGGANGDELTGGPGADVFRFFTGDTQSLETEFHFDVIRDFKWWEGDKIDLQFTGIENFVGYNEYPAEAEVGYWSWGDSTIVRYNDGGSIHDIELDDLQLVMIESDFIL